MSNGNVGSIYFGVGRIRLTHGNGPEISTHAAISRFTISQQDYRQYRAWRSSGVRTNVQRFTYVTTMLPSCAPAVAGAGGKLIEFFGANGINGSHPSRGGPAAFNFALNQAQLNLLYHAANTGSNDTLRNAMLSDGLLATIPIN